jgi:hypothetical protein
MNARHLTDTQLVELLDCRRTEDAPIEAPPHLSGCRHCQQRLETLRAALDDFSSLHVADQVEPTWAHLRSRLTQAMRDMDLDLRTRRRGLFGIPYSWLGTGLAVVIVTIVLAQAGARVGDPAESPMDQWLPKRAFTPGAVTALTAEALCAGERPSRTVAADVRAAVLRRYHVAHISQAEYELDALITPELGGSVAADNLWPQRYRSPVWNAHVKDQLERLLPELVCRGQIALATAQQEVATNWIAAYREHFHTARPLPEHVTARLESDDDDLIFAAPVTRRAVMSPDHLAPGWSVLRASWR